MAKSQGDLGDLPPAFDEKCVSPFLWGMCGEGGLDVRPQGFLAQALAQKVGAVGPALSSLSSPLHVIWRFLEL